MPYFTIPTFYISILKRSENIGGLPFFVDTQYNMYMLSTYHKRTNLMIKMCEELQLEFEHKTSCLVDKLSASLTREL